MNLVTVAELKEAWRQKTNLSCKKFQQEWPDNAPKVEDLNADELSSLVLLTLYHTSRKDTKYLTWTISEGGNRITIMGKGSSDGLFIVSFCEQHG